MAEPSLSTDMLMRAFMPAPSGAPKGGRLPTILVTLGGLATWMTDAIAQNVASLKAKLPDPIAMSVSFSGLLAVGKQTRTMTNVAGVKKGDRIVATATAALPGNLMLGAAYAPADGQVSIEFGVLAAMTLQAVSVPLVLTVLR